MEAAPVEGLTLPSRDMELARFLLKIVLFFRPVDIFPEVFLSGDKAVAPGIGVFFCLPSLEMESLGSTSSWAAIGFFGESGLIYC